MLSQLSSRREEHLKPLAKLTRMRVVLERCRMVTPQGKNTSESLVCDRGGSRGRRNPGAALANEQLICPARRNLDTVLIDGYAAERCASAAPVWVVTTRRQEIRFQRPPGDYVIRRSRRLREIGGQTTIYVH